MANKSSKPANPGSAKPDEATDETAATSEQIVDAEIIDDDASEPTAEKGTDLGEIVEAEEPATEATDETETPVEPKVERPDAPKSSVLPFVFGGVIAGAIGFAAAYVYPMMQDLEVEVVPVVAVSDFEALKSEVALLPAPLTADAIAALVAEQTADLTAQLEDMSRRITEVSSRLEQALNTPAEAGALSPAALADYQAEIVALREELSAQQAAIAEMVDAASVQLEQAQAQSQAFEQTAAEAAQTAALRMALSKIQAALETGTPYQSAMTDLSSALDGSVPAAISSSASNGVPTLAKLQADFDPAADRALAVARAEGVDGEERTALGAFIRSQFDVRSVTPQEGNSVDAILSRAQAALNEARLTDALAEVRSLPEVARAELTDWISSAEARAAALAAVEELVFTLSEK